MIALYVLAALLVLTGGIIVTVHVLRQRSSFAFLLDRGIDPHLWGFHVLGAGFMLSLVLMTLRQTPWGEESWAARAILSAAGAWITAALLMSIAAVLTRTRAGVSVPLFPSPNEKLNAWARSYRAFIALGFVALGALAVIAF